MYWCFILNLSNSYIQYLSSIFYVTINPLSGNFHYDNIIYLLFIIPYIYYDYYYSIQVSFIQLSVNRLRRDKSTDVHEAVTITYVLMFYT